jgi:hypothetical protein
MIVYSYSSALPNTIDMAVHAATTYKTMSVIATTRMPPLPRQGSAYPLSCITIFGSPPSVAGFENSRFSCCSNLPVSRYLYDTTGGKAYDANRKMDTRRVGRVLCLSRLVL